MTLGTLSLSLSFSVSLSPLFLCLSLSFCLSLSLCLSLPVSLSLSLSLSLSFSLCVSVSLSGKLEDIMEKFKQIILHLIGLDFFSEGPIFSGVPCYQERGTLQFQILAPPPPPRFLTLIWVDFLRVRFKYTAICSFRKYTFQGPLNFTYVSIFLAKNQRFLAKIVPLLKAIVWELCQRFFSSVFNFCKIKGSYWWKYKIYRLCVRNSTSGLLQIGRKLKKS